MNRPDYNEARKRTKEMVQIRNFTLEDKYKKIGQGKKFFLKTYGCQMNEHDSENIKGMLNEMSFTETLDMEDADLILLNTCSIRENAHNKAFGLLGRIKHLKETKPSIVAGICGCMAQEEGVIKEILAKYRFLNFVFGTHNLDELPTLVEKGFEGSKLNIDVKSIEGDIIEDIPFTRDSKYKAYINIIYGCDKFCTYCIVPYTRGKQRSRLKEDIIKEVEDLVKDGYKEVTLLGQNVNAYGKDFKDAKYNMANLLEDVSKTKIERIKFVTSHPWDFTDDMIKVIKENENILPYIHLPVQSGSNRILKLMGRKYTKESYLDLVKKLKENIPNICLTTDIIVGFPNETDEDFEKTCEFVKKVNFSKIHVFPYSRRKGTKADLMNNQISEDIKKTRVKRMLEISHELEISYMKKYLNKDVEVLVEKYENGYIMGHTSNYIEVKKIGKCSDVTNIVNAKLKEIDYPIMIE